RAQTSRGHRGGDRLDVGLSGYRFVDRLEPPGGGEQERGRIRTAPSREHDLGAQSLQLSSLKGIERPKLGIRHESRSRGEIDDIELCLRCAQRTLDAHGGVWSQFRCALQESGGGGEPTARLRTSG